MGRIFSPGKLLLTSEYFVLDGALALAVPTKPGQEFFFEELEDGRSEIIWDAFHQNFPWLYAKIDYRKWQIVETNLPDAAVFVIRVLQKVQQLSVHKFRHTNSYLLQTNLQFPADFGLGSSSTLMNNLAEWAAIDPFELNELSLGGSGYDIAVAQEKTAILFQNKPTRTIRSIEFAPDFRNELVFIHMNQKQDSRAGINLYRTKEKSSELIGIISQLTLEVLRSTDLPSFSAVMERHEGLVSEFLGLKTVKNEYFADYGGVVKSLGAWGVDFVLATKYADYKSYFSDRGYTSIFEWNDLIHSQ